MNSNWFDSVVSKIFHGSWARLSILIYHRVLSKWDPINPAEVDRGTFRWQMELVKKYFNVLPLDEAILRLSRGRLPSRSLCITFDDGYADNVEIALPILREFGLPATFFIATGFLEGGRMWNDTVIETVRRLPTSLIDLRCKGAGYYKIDSFTSRVDAISKILSSIKYYSQEKRQEIVDQLEEMCGGGLPDNLMMTIDQVRKLRDAGMEVGAHSVTHPILARLPATKAWWEIAESREVLESVLGERVRLFAYPNGQPNKDYFPEHVNMVRKMRFEGAVSTAWGVSTHSSDRWQLRRFTPWDKSPSRFMLRLLHNCLRTS